MKKKYGVDLIKCEGRAGVFYAISSPRALTMYEEMKDELYIPIDSIQMDDLICFILIGVAATPQGVFRGSKKDFLDYIGLAHNQKNIELLTAAFNEYCNREDSVLVYKEDEDYIIVYIDRNFEKKQIINIKMLRDCQSVAKKYNKQTMKIVQLLKVWQAYRINDQKGVHPLTNQDIKQYIDLSDKQIRDARKLLEAEGFLITNRVGNYEKRTGTEYTLNAFEDTQKVVIED